MEQVDVVVIGQNYSTSLGLIQAAGEAGFRVGVVHYSSSIPKHTPLEFISKYVCVRLFAERNKENELLKALIENFSKGTHKPVLIPSHDTSVIFIDSYLHILERYFYVPHIFHQSGEMTRYMDKSLQSKLAVESGLRKAPYWIIELDGSPGFAIPKDIVFPCITKPLCSVGSLKSYIRRCSNAEELKKVLSEINNNRPSPILVEQFITIDNEYTIPGVAIGDAIHIPSFIQKGKVGSGNHKGVTIAGKVIKSNRFESVVACLKLLIRTIGLQGIFDIELIESNGVFFFNELNLRYGAAGYALTRAGVNIPAIWINYCLFNKAPEPNYSFKEGLSFVSDKAAIENLLSGYMSIREYKSLISSSDFRFLIDNKDQAIRKKMLFFELKVLLSKRLGIR